MCVGVGLSSPSKEKPDPSVLCVVCMWTCLGGFAKAELQPRFSNWSASITSILHKPTEAAFPPLCFVIFLCKVLHPFLYVLPLCLEKD